MTDTAIVHWGEHCNGGAERVAWECQRTFDAPLYVGHRDPSIEPDDLEDVRQLFGGGLTERAIEMGGFPRAAAYFANWSLNGDVIDQLRKYDTVVTSGNETLFYCGPDTQTRIHYCHHTSRRHTDLLHAWSDHRYGVVGRAYAFVIRQLINNPTNRPDLFVCNSEVVARRVRRYWGVDDDRVRVVYPPVDVETYGREHAPTQDYYVHLGRLDDWHKHISDIIDAFNETALTLKIAGSGPDEDALREQAGDNVEFLGYVSEERKRELLAGAKAMVFAGEHEDFGISTAEALASGTPVIGPEEGFTQYQINPPKAGITFSRHGSPSLRTALVDFEASGVEWSEAEIERHAQRFSATRFRRELREAVGGAEERARVDVEWADEPAPTAPQQPAAADGGLRHD